MLQVTVGEVAQALGCTYEGDADQVLRGLAIDSRQVQDGDLFVALIGEKVDGHRYVTQALARGAAAVAISRRETVDLDGLGTYLMIHDGLDFIQQLGRYIRRKSALPVVAITGSSGKTTTKDLLAAILQCHGATVATAANHNNELGLPLTLCQIEAQTRFAVVEMGMRGLGQIAELCEIAEPNLGIITNIGKVHSALLGSQEAIAQAKAELLTFIDAEGVVALNQQDFPLLAPWLAGCRGRVIWCSMTPGVGDVWAEEVVCQAQHVSYQLVWQGERHPMMLNLPGLHNVQNSLMAAVIAHSLQVPWATIQAAFMAIKLTGMRLEMLTNAQGVQVINDAYNANPEAMIAALEVLRTQAGQRKVAVLGDMYELGQYEAQSHRDIGKVVATHHIDQLVVVGALGHLIGEGALAQGKSADTVHFAADNQEAVMILQQLLQSQDVVLVKGSRGMAMEEIVQRIMG